MIRGTSYTHYHCLCESVCVCGPSTAAGTALPVPPSMFSPMAHTGGMPATAHQCAAASSTPPATGCSSSWAVVHLALPEHLCMAVDSAGDLADTVAACLRCAASVVWNTQRSESRPPSLHYPCARFPLPALRPVLLTPHAQVHLRAPAAITTRETVPEFSTRPPGLFRVWLLRHLLRCHPVPGNLLHLSDRLTCHLHTHAGTCVPAPLQPPWSPLL